MLFGEVLVDRFPDRGVLGGAPFNVARHLQGFGLHPVLISRTGNDSLRGELMATMTSLGMDRRGLQADPSHPTGQVLVHLENGSHRFEILPDQAYDFIDTEHAKRTALAVRPRLIYFGTLAQRHPVSRRALAAVLEGSDAPCFLDINLREPWYEPATLRHSLKMANILKLNNDELPRLGDLLGLEDQDDESLARRLLQAFDLSTILVTCGAAGAWLLAKNGRRLTVKAEKTVRIIDSVGAGDGFSAIFILGKFYNWPLEQTISRADAFARAICGIQGAVPKNDTFYDSFRSQWNLIDGDLQ